MLNQNLREAKLTTPKGSTKASGITCLLGVFLYKQDKKEGTIAVVWEIVDQI